MGINVSNWSLERSNHLRNTPTFSRANIFSLYTHGNSGTHLNWNSKYDWNIWIYSDGAVTYHCKFTFEFAQVDIIFFWYVWYLGGCTMVQLSQEHSHRVIEEKAGVYWLLWKKWLRGRRTVWLIFWVTLEVSIMILIIKMVCLISFLQKCMAILNLTQYAIICLCRP